MNRYLFSLMSLFILTLAVMGCSNGGGGSDNVPPPSDPVPASTMMIKMGAASSPKYGSVFDAMTRDFERSGQPFEFTLYQNYYQLIDAFLSGEVDIAWNTPLAHARAVVLTNDDVIGPIARDVDIQYTTHLIVRKDSGINTVQDIIGRTVALGNIESSELNLLPCYYMKELEGIDLETQTNLVNYSGLVDDQMNALSSATHVLNAVTNGTDGVEAGFVGEKVTRPIRNDPAHPLKVIWISPGFTHCIMTLRKNYPPQLLKVFKEVLLAETMADPIGNQVLVDEGCDRLWLDSQNTRDEVTGFQDLLAAMEEYDAPLVNNAVPDVRIGALSNVPNINALKALERYILREGGPSFEFILYGTQRQLDNALLGGRIDIAWNEPKAHAHLLNQFGSTQIIAPLTTDTDKNYNFGIVVRKDSGINTLSDLTGRSLLLGGEDKAELSIIPRTQLDLTNINIISRDGVIASDTRKRLDVDEAIASSVETGEGDAGVVGRILADEITADPTSNLKVIHISSNFAHKTMTALSGYDQATLDQFNTLLQGMTLSDPTGEVVLENVFATRFEPNSNDGYNSLVDAIRAGK